eukprot:gene25448-20907_t
MLVEETGQLRKENNAKDVQLAAAKEAVQAEVKKAASASTKADSLSSDLEKVFYNYNGYADSAAAEAAHSSSDGSVLGRYLNTSKIRCMTESEKGTKNCRRSLTFAKDGRQQATSNEAGCSGTKVCRQVT